MKFSPLFFRVVVIGAVWLDASRAVGAGSTDAGDSSLKLLKEASLMLLKEGNTRFVTGKAQHPNQEADRRVNTAALGQEPFATILACSDSRDPVELIFDRGVGDLFVIRVAGNIAGISELATVEYGVGHLHTPLLVVMGHTKCGAVTAVVKGAQLHGHLSKLAEKIKPAVTRARIEAGTTDDAVPKAIQANVWQTIADIVRQSPDVREKIQAGAVMVVGAVYDLETGRVSWMGAHPEMEHLLAQGGPPELHGKPEAPGHAHDASAHHPTAPAKLPLPSAPPVHTIIQDPHGTAHAPPSAKPSKLPAVRAREPQ